MRDRGGSMPHRARAFGQRPQEFFPGQLAIAIGVELAQGGGGVGNLVGANNPILVGIEGCDNGQDLVRDRIRLVPRRRARTLFLLGNDSDAGCGSEQQSCDDALRIGLHFSFLWALPGPSVRIATIRKIFRSKSKKALAENDDRATASPELAFVSVIAIRLIIFTAPAYAEAP